MSRYKNRILGVNSKKMYDKTFEKRGVKKIVQYRTPTATYASEEVLKSIETDEYVWKWGDSLWRLAAEYYGDPNYWWVIATYNRKPTEFHIKTGETILIPVYLADALQVVE